MTHPAERRLNRIATDIGWLQARLPDALAALELIVATGYPAGRGDGRGGSTNTSVEAAVTHPARDQADQLDALTASLAGQVTELVDHVKRLPTRLDPRLKNLAASEALRARCSGGEGEWADPHCANLEIRTIESDQIQGVRLGVCWSCIKRRQRWSQRHDEQATA